MVVRRVTLRQVHTSSDRSRGLYRRTATRLLDRLSHVKRQCREDRRWHHGMDSHRGRFGRQRPPQLRTRLWSTRNQRYWDDGGAPIAEGLLYDMTSDGEGKQLAYLEDHLATIVWS
jgi:hypothetical protein